MDREHKEKWRFCVVGNIVKTHLDENGVMRFGTAAFTGGTRVYLCGKYWSKDCPDIGVLGLTRGKRFQFNIVPISLIENVRCRRVYNPVILEWMGEAEYTDDWWYDTAKDRREIGQFLAAWNEVLSKQSHECSNVATD